MNQEALFQKRQVIIKDVESLTLLAKGEIDGSHCKLSFDPCIASITIRVEGENYGAFIPGEQLRTLWELQEDFYRLAAFILHDTTDIRSLTQEERQLFEFKVETQKGSWLGQILTGDFWSSLFENTVGKMSGIEIGLTICGCVLIGAGYLAWDSRNKRLIALEKEKTDQIKSENLTKIIESFNNANSDRLKACCEQADVALLSSAERIAKRSHGANSVSVGNRVFDKDEIDQLKARSKSERVESMSTSGSFEILSLDKGSSVWTMKVRNEVTGEELVVKLAPDAIDGDGEEAKRVALDAFYQDQPIELEATLGKKRNLVTSIECISIDSAL